MVFMLRVRGFAHNTGSKLQYIVLTTYNVNSVNEERLPEMVQKKIVLVSTKTN